MAKKQYRIATAPLEIQSLGTHDTAMALPRAVLPFIAGGQSAPPMAPPLTRKWKNILSESVLKRLVTVASGLLMD